MLSALIVALLPLTAQAAQHSPWARTKPGNHARHARAVNSTIPKLAYEAPAVNASAVTAVASTWFAGWHGDEADFPPENLTWSKYTSVAYAFAETTPSITGLNVSAEDDPILRRVVQLGRANNVNVTIAIGGWTGSRFFSSAVATPENRTLFVTAINDLVQHYSLDGVNFDWEYPNHQGIGCNTISSNDTANFLALLKELRASSRLSKGAILTAAVGLTPFAGPDGTPSADVSEFAKYLDHIEIMNYDVWGSWSNTAGPNAPLNDTCVANPSTEAVGSAVSAVKAWTTAGIPASQIVLAVGSYGHSFAVNKTDAFPSSSTTSKNKTLATFPKFDAAAQPDGDKWQDPAGLDVCGIEEPKGGNFDFWGLVDGGFLTKNGTAAPGIDYVYDSCSQTPSVYNASSGVFVSYDDARSFEAKGAYIVDAGLKGFAMWEAAGDYKDILLDAIRSGAGFEEVTEPDCDDEPSGPTSVKPTYAHSTPVHATAKPIGSAPVANPVVNPAKTPVASAPAATATSSPTSADDDNDDDDEEVDCDDDEDTTASSAPVSAPAKTSAAAPTPSASAPASSDDGDDGDDDDEDCEEY